MLSALLKHLLGLCSHILTQLFTLTVLLNSEREHLGDLLLRKLLQKHLQGLGFLLKVERLLDEDRE